MKDDIKEVRYKHGRFYFTRAVERKLFFFLTLAMLAAGVMFKAGLF
jgi:hypothetical protein